MELKEDFVPVEYVHLRLIQNTSILVERMN